MSKEEIKDRIIILTKLYGNPKRRTPYTYKELLMLESRYKSIEETKSKQKLFRCDKGIKRETYKQELPYKMRSYIARANKKQIPFELTKEQFESFLTMDCYYCNNKSNSIDRINSKKGYVMDNCQPCCKKCNTAKWDMTHEQFLDHILNIHSKMFPE